MYSIGSWPPPPAAMGWTVMPLHDFPAYCLMHDRQMSAGKRRNLLHGAFQRLASHEGVGQTRYSAFDNILHCLLKIPILPECIFSTVFTRWILFYYILYCLLKIHFLHCLLDIHILPPYSHLFSFSYSFTTVSTVFLRYVLPLCSSHFLQIYFLPLNPQLFS